MKVAAIALLIPFSLLGQMRDNRDQQLTCEAHNYKGPWRFDRFQGHECEMREQAVAATGRIAVEPVLNGSVTVKGWLRKDMLVRSRVDVWSYEDPDASKLLSQVRIEVANSTVMASGPSNFHRSGWSVSYEIFVPRQTSLDARAVNGGINVSDVDGTMHLETTNGTVNLVRVAGDVRGETRNGGVQVELEGSTWRGRQLDVGTRNGVVTISVPASYSARLEAETLNGSVRSEVPLTVEGRRRRRHTEGTIGSGGPLIHISTVNGGVTLKRS